MESKGIYLDNAATTRLSPGALAAMLPFLAMEGGNPSGSHRFAREAKKALEQSRETLKQCLGCGSGALLFTASGSEGNNTVLRSAPIVTGKRHIIASAVEHPAILNTLKDMAALGRCTYTLLPVDEDGSVSPEALEAAIQPDTCLISVMLANNEVGTLEPVEALCRLAHAHDILFHTDAVQAAGHIPVDAEKLGVDYMTVAAHKFHGPKGMGALYIRKGAPMHPFITGGEQERDLRAGTHNVPGAVGMACAMEEAVKNMEEDVPRITALRDKLIEGILAAVPDTRLNGPRQNRLPQNVSFGFPGVAADRLLMLLDRHGLAASSGSACLAGSLEPSHVLLAMGRTEREARSALRLSLSRCTLKSEIETAMTLIPACVGLLKK